MSNLDLSQFLSPEVYRHLQTYQQQQGHPSVIVALNHLLQDYFAPPTNQESQQQIEGLESRVYTLTREVMLLRQSVPDQCDRLREQLAAVRLSHSGLLQNLRQRLEVLEQGGIPVDPSLLNVTPTQQDMESK